MADNRLVSKLGIKAGQRVLVVNAPEGYLHLLGALPGGSEVETCARGEFDFVQLFAHHKADIDGHAGTALGVLRPGGILWLSYPKKSSKVETDITRDTGWDLLRDGGWRPVSQVAIDDTWSALRFRSTSEVKSRS